MELYRLRTWLQQFLLYHGHMFKTKYAVIAVVVAIVVLLGLLVAVRVSAPTATEAATVPATVLFAVDGEAAYPVFVARRDQADSARNQLINKMYAGEGKATDVREEYLYPAPQPQEPVVVPLPYPYPTPIESPTTTPPTRIPYEAPDAHAPATIQATSSEAVSVED